MGTKTAIKQCNELKRPFFFSPVSMNIWLENSVIWRRFPCPTIAIFGKWTSKWELLAKNQSYRRPTRASQHKQLLFENHQKRLLFR